MNIICFRRGIAMNLKLMKKARLNSETALVATSSAILEILSETDRNAKILCGGKILER